MQRGLFLLAPVLLLGLSISGYADQAQLKGDIRIDGSSTVFPISEAVAEEFGRLHRDVRVMVGTSGTGGGFKKFARGDIDISDASRPIKASEKAEAKKHGVQYDELPVAFDGITIVVNSKNTWVDHLTVAELKKIWQPGSKVKTWKDVRSTWPAEKILLFGPGPDSGTFDFFTETINGKSQASRTNFTKSEDDNVLVRGVQGNKNAMGYFGYAYYLENQGKLKAVPIQNKEGQAVAPSEHSIHDGTYTPLSRPVFIYVSKKASKRPEVRAFVKFYMTEGPALAKEVGFVPMPPTEYKKALQKYESQK